MEFLSNSGSYDEDLFLLIYSDTYGAEKAGFLYPQHPF